MRWQYRSRSEFCGSNIRNERLRNPFVGWSCKRTKVRFPHHLNPMISCRYITIVDSRFVAPLYVYWKTFVSVHKKGGFMEMVVPKGVGSGGHYSPGVKAGGFIFVSGQTPRNEERRVIGTTIEEQTAATMENIRRVLAASGASLDDVVKATVHLQSLDDAAQFNAAYARYFPNRKPARTTVGSQLNGVLVEIDVIAFVGHRDANP